MQLEMQFTLAYYRDPCVRASAGRRFTIYKVHKASKKKREKSSAKKERKATKTLAIVLGKSKPAKWPNGKWQMARTIIVT